MIIVSFNSSGGLNAEIYSRFVQTLNPKSNEWVRIDRELGKIVGHRKKKYKCPIAQKK